MANVRFEDHSLEVMAALAEKADTFLEEAAIIVEGEAKRNTPTGKSQLKGSWAYEVNNKERTAQIGSPMEDALWNEYGTGSHAEAKHGGTGKGRKGWWVYVAGQPRSKKNSTVYANEREAEAVASSMRAQGFDAHATNGSPAEFTLYNAFQAKKGTIERMAEEKMKELGQ